MWLIGRNERPRRNVLSMPSSERTKLRRSRRRTMELYNRL
jgi:hypothetical protein